VKILHAVSECLPFIKSGGLADVAGSLPKAGGLNDTVCAYDEWAETGNGFSFTHFNPHDMLYTIRCSLSFYIIENQSGEKW